MNGQHMGSDPIGSSAPAYRERASRIDGAILWTSTGEVGGIVAPDGCMDVLWMGGQLVVAGPDDVPQETGPRSPGTIAGVRLAPGDGAALLRTSARELRNQRVPLEQLVDARIHRRMLSIVDATVGLRTCAAVQPVEAAQTAAALERAVADFARMSRLEAGRTTRRTLSQAVASGASVAQIARETAWSERQLHRRSVELFGYGLRTLGRILRFQRASKLMAAGVPLADVAAACGYADQPHLSREVRALAGRPPTSL